jgi:GTP-binding protein HflX
LILLIIDASDPLTEIQRKLSTSLEIIQKIGAQGIPIVTALNKTDLLSEPEILQRLDAVKGLVNDTVAISALNEENVSTLRQELAKHLKEYVRASFSIPLSNEALSLLSGLFNSADVKSVEYKNDFAEATFEAEQNFADKVLGRVRSCGGRVREITELT